MCMQKDDKWCTFWLHKDYSGRTIVDAWGISCSNSTRTVFDKCWFDLWMIMLQLWYRNWWRRNWSASTVCVCVCPTANTLCPHNRKVLELCRSIRSKQSTKAPPPENFLTIAVWWLFRAQHLSHYSTRLVRTIVIFDCCHFKIVTTHCYYYCRLGHAL